MNAFSFHLWSEVLSVSSFHTATRIPPIDNFILPSPWHIVVYFYEGIRHVAFLVHVGTNEKL